MSPWLSDVLLRSQSDERLVALAREGREKAFTTLVERYHRPLLSFARSLGAGPRAEDVVQQALMQAWSSLLAGGEVEHVRGWLHQIVRNATWKSAARAPGSVELPEGLVGSQGPHDEVEDRIRVSAMVSEVLKLPDRQRTALVQTALEGRSRQEIAAGLGLSESAVRQLVHRGRSTVRAACTALTPGPALAWAASPRQGSSMSERVAEAMAGGGAAGLAGVLVKGGVVVAAAGALATSTIVAPDHAKASHSAAGAVAPVVREIANKNSATAARGAGGPAGAQSANARLGPGQGRSRGRDNAASLGANGAQHSAAGRAGALPSRGRGEHSAAGGDGSEHRGPGGETGGGGDRSGRDGGGESHGGPGPSGSSGSDGSHSGSGSSRGDGLGDGSSGSGSSGSGSGSGTSGSGSGSSGPGSGDGLDAGSRDGLTRSGDSGDGGLPLDDSGSHSRPG